MPNPQTSHQALLLVSQLAAFLPEQVIQNVMPIFTFMGANVLQRDDAFSSRVVDQAVECIVPALVRSARSSAVDRSTLLSGAWLPPCAV